MAIYYGNYAETFKSALLRYTCILRSNMSVAQWSARLTSMLGNPGRNSHGKQACICLPYKTHFAFIYFAFLLTLLFIAAKHFF